MYFREGLFQLSRNEKCTCRISTSHFDALKRDFQILLFRFCSQEAFTAAIFDDTSIACIRQALIFHNDEPESVPPTDFGQLFGMLLMLLYFTVGVGESYYRVIFY